MSENKTGKYLKYATGEIVLVVIGILIALSINNWNENRKTYEKERMYLSSLKQDFNETKRDLTRVTDKTESVKKITNLLLSLQGNPMDTLDNGILDSLIMRSRGYTIFMTSEATIKDLISSGNLNLISNDTLRGLLAAWEADLKPIRGWEEHSKNSVFELSSMLNEIGDNYNYRTDNRPLFSDSMRDKVLSDLKFRNTFDDIRRYSTFLNNLYKEKSFVIDTIVQIINRDYKRLNND